MNVIDRFSVSNSSWIMDNHTAALLGECVLEEEGADFHITHCSCHLESGLHPVQSRKTNLELI